MIKTGFYEIVVRKESERQITLYEEEKELRARLAELHIKLPDDNAGGANRKE